MREAVCAGWLLVGWLGPGGVSTAAVLPAAASAVEAEQQQGPGVDVSDALKESRTLIDAGRPKAAIAKLQALDATDPRVAQALGVAYYHADDPVRAVEVLKPVVDKLPPNSLEGREAVQVLGLSLYVAQHLAEAIPYLEKTRVWAPDNLELLYVLGNAYVQTRQADPARDAFARLFKVTPDSAAAHLLTAQMMVRLDFEELAEAELKKAMVKDPRLPQVHFLLAQAALFRSRFDEAVALMQQELEINPGNAMALYRLGEVYTRQGKWDEAIAALQKSLWINPAFSGPYILLGKAYTKKGQPEAAEGMLRRAVQYDPNNKAAHYLLAQLLQQTGRADEAKKEFEIAERLQDPADR